MKKSLIPLFCLFLGAKLLALPVAPTLAEADLNPQEVYPLRVEYPHQDKIMPSGIKNMFLFGRVYKKDGQLKLNGQPISLYKNGSFLTFQPLTPGENEFIFELVSQDGKESFKRNVFVSGFDYKEYEGKYKFDTTEVFPSSEVKLKEGDSLNFFIYASAKRKITLTILSHKDIAMKENPKEPGLYETKIIFDKQDISYRALNTNWKN